MRKFLKISIALIGLVMDFIGSDCSWLSWVRISPWDTEKLACKMLGNCNPDQLFIKFIYFIISLVSKS